MTGISGGIGERGGGQHESASADRLQVIWLRDFGMENSLPVSS